MFKHLRQTNETYYQHFKCANRISFKLFVGSIQCLIHAFYPDVYQDAVTIKCKSILDTRYNKKDYQKI